MTARREITTITPAKYWVARRAIERRDAAAEREMRRRAAIAERAQRALATLHAVSNHKRTVKQNKRMETLHREYIQHYDAVLTLAVNKSIGGVSIGLADRALLSSAASTIIGIADNYGICLIDIIAEIERYIVQETKVTDARGEERLPGRNQYTLAPRLARWLPSQTIDCGAPLRRRVKKKRKSR